MNRGIFTVLGAIIVVGLAGLYLLQHGQALFNSPPPTDRIAFISTRGGQTDLWTMKGDGDDKRQVTSDIGMDISPAWSPDCREIVSASNREENRYEIYVTAWNGKYIKRLTTSSGTKDLPGWSPDGKEIVFLSSGTVHVLSRFKGDDVQIMPTVEQGATQFARPFAAVKWAPDRRSLAAVEDADTTRRALVREDFDNPDREPIPLITAGSVELAWSKKDYRVAVAFVDREGANGIQVADPANMDFQDIFERRLGAETERRRALRIEFARPAGNDLLDHRIALAPDAGDHLLTAHLAQRLDLLADRAGKPRHGEIAARPDLGAIDRCRMDEKTHRRARARMPMHHIIRDRQHGFLPGKRLATDIGEEAGCRLVRQPRPHADRRKADADAVEKAAA